MANAADLAGVTIEMGGWTLVPLHDGVATSHIIAARDDDKARDTDIDVVLYIRTAEGWEAEAYEPSTGKEDALIALAAEFGLPDPMSGEWGIEDLDPEAVTGFAPPRAAFKTGFFADDPLSDAASGMSDPGPLVEAAETLGLPAAGSAVNTQGLGSVPTEPQPHPEECGCLLVPCLHDSIAAGIDAMLADPDLPFESIEAIAHESLSGGGPEFICCPWVWNNWVGPWSAWQCTSGWAYHDRYSHSPNQDTCVYRRGVERVQERIRTKRCFNCLTHTRRQTRTQTGLQETVGAPILRTDPCPAGPTGWTHPPCSAGPNVPFSTSTSGWTPPLPPC